MLIPERNLVFSIIVPPDYCQTNKNRFLFKMIRYIFIKKIFFENWNIIFEGFVVSRPKSYEKNEVLSLIFVNFWIRNQMNKLDLFTFSESLRKVLRKVLWKVPGEGPGACSESGPRQVRGRSQAGPRQIPVPHLSPVSFFTLLIST